MTTTNLQPDHEQSMRPQEKIPNLPDTTHYSTATLITADKRRRGTESWREGRLERSGDGDLDGLGLLLGRWLLLHGDGEHAVLAARGHGARIRILRQSELAYEQPRRRAVLQLDVAAVPLLLLPLPLPVGAAAAAVVGALF